MRQMKVIIVEDEPIVIRYIKRILDSCGGFSVIAACESAEEAEAVFRQNRPDLLITDIKMPGITGLELVRRIKKHGGDLQVIIVSGYKDFSYAREAIQLGVEDYITKPINPEELKSTLLRLRDSYWQQISARQAFALEKHLREQNEDAFRARFPFSCCSALAVYQSGDVEELDYAAVFDADCVSFFYRNSLMILAGDMNRAEKTFEQIRARISAADNKQRTITIMAVRQVDLSKDCFSAFQRIYRVLREQTILGKQLSVQMDNCRHAPDTIRYQDEAQMKRLENIIASKEWRNLPGHIRELFVFWEKEQYDLYHIKNAVHQITDQLYKMGAFEQGKLIINEYLDDCIRYADSYSRLRETICGYLEKILRRQNAIQQESKNARLLYEDICRFVLNNLNQNYSLNEICYMFKVSQPFVRKAFRTSSGKSYNEWVLDTKISRAKALLQENSKLLVKDVAMQLGYEQLYFSTVFNKYVGMSPSEYRYLVQEESQD